MGSYTLSFLMAIPNERPTIKDLGRPLAYHSNNTVLRTKLRISAFYNISTSFASKVFFYLSLL